MGVLAMPELWVGLGLFAVVASLVLGSNPQKKRFKSRMERVTRRGPRAVAAGNQSLRR